MALVTSQGMVQRFAMGLYGVQLGSITMGQVMTDVNNAGGLPKINDIFNYYYSFSFINTSTTDVAKAIVANLGIVAGKNGLTAANVTAATDYVAGQLASVAADARGGKVPEILNLWSNLTADKTFGAAATAWNAQTAYADVYATRATLNMDVGLVVTTFNLLNTNDNFTGSSGSDLFVADYAGNGNTLASGDKIAGGEGVDTLDAVLVAADAIEPSVSGVEIIKLQAQNTNNTFGDNNIAGVNRVLVDAGRISGMTTLENNNSRADLVVEDVRLDAGKITKDLTIVMRETDPGNVDYGVYFDQGSLRNVSASNSQINVRVLDTYAVSQAADALRDSPYGSFTFSYKVGTGALTAVTLASQAMQDAKTLPAMVTAMQAAADAKFGAGVVSVKLGSAYTVPDPVTGSLVTGTEIVLSATGAITFDTTVAGSGWLATETVPAISGLYTSFNTASTSTTALVTSTIVLDDVGRGSTGGDLVVGGLSVGDTSTSKGVQRFEITVEDNSKLQTINSTNNTLREVTIVNGTTTRADDAYTTTVANAGNLTVNGKETNNANNNVLPGLLIDANRDGDTVDVGENQHNEFGFSDVRLIDGSAMGGKLAFTAEVTGASLAKYLNLTDTANDPAADNVAFVYTGGANDDTMSITLDQGVMAARDMLTGREDFSFTANGGAGNDAITVNIVGNESAAWYSNHQANKNLTIDAGAGNDTVKLPGAGAAKVLAGAGDDVVYLDNSGTVGAKWVINDTPAAILADPLANANARGFMYDGKVTVAFSGAGGTGLGGGVTATAADSIAAAFTNGFEVVASIPTGANYTVTQLHINQAIKTAINTDPVLKTLLKAEDGPASTLLISSLIDGAFNANDLRITVSSADLNTLTAGTQATVLTAYKAFAQDSTATIAAAQVENAATVVKSNAAAGMDVNQVLGTSAVSTLTINTVTVPGVNESPATPAVNEKATFTAVDLIAGQTVSINGLTFTAGAGGASAATVKAAFIANVANAAVGGPADGGVMTGAALAAYGAPVAAAGQTFVYTSTVAGNVVDLAAAGTAPFAAVITPNVAAVAAGVVVAGVKEVATVTFGGTGAVETLTFEGQAINLTALDTPATAAAALIASVNGNAASLWVAAPGGAGVVTLTAKATGNIADAVITSSITNGNTGSISAVESDNSVDLGAGTDVAVLGTGAASNDTVVFTGYGIGKNTVVNFEDTVVASRDMLDFKAYLTGKVSLSGSTDSQKSINVSLNADATVEANSVTVLTTAAFTTVNTFAGLTADKLLAAVNSTNTGTANYAGITAASLDALTTYTTAAGATNLVGGVGKAVVLVQNNGNEGEYAMYELTFSGLAANANKDFTSAQLIGTVDFGNQVDFNINVLATYA